jgi:hypothetical protein
MNTLCAQIATEKDRDRFTQLVTELNDLLNGKEHRLETPHES